MDRLRTLEELLESHIALVKPVFVLEVILLVTLLEKLDFLGQRI
jgi:hypothetical protein